MKTIEDLEKELEIAKKIELKQKWETYLSQVKSFLDKLIGVTIISHDYNCGFTLFKLLGYEEKYYIDREGWNGNWSPCRWIEIKTSSHITCKVADSSGKWYSNSGIHHSNTYSFKSIVYKGKYFPKEMEMSKIYYHIYDNSEKILATIPETIKLGYTEYNEYRDDPNSSRVIEKFLVSTQIAPEGMWEKAKEIADDNFMKTKLFWEEFNPKCNDLKPLTEIISFK